MHCNGWRVIDPYSPYHGWLAIHQPLNFSPVARLRQTQPKHILFLMTNCSLHSTDLLILKRTSILYPLSWDPLNSDQMSSSCIQVEKTLQCRGLSRTKEMFLFCDLVFTLCSCSLFVCFVQTNMFQVFYKGVGCPRHSCHTQHRGLHAFQILTIRIYVD